MTSVPSQTFAPGAAFRVAAWLAISGLAVLAASGRGGAQTRPALAEVEATVERELARESDLRNVTVAVQEGMIELDGTVPHLAAKRRAIEIGLSVEGFEVASLLTIPMPESDRQIAEMATSLIRRYGFYTVYDDLNVEVVRGAVQLTGEVTEPHKRIDVESFVSRLPGVQEIDNQIEVLPTSGVDDRIRAAVARAIYGHTLFSKYAGLPNPPIHIIVRGGQVRLTGVVNSSVESEFASMLARQVDAVRRFRNELRVESEEPR